MRLAESITTKNITSVDEVQSVDNTDKVFVNDNGSFKQISVSNLMKQAPSGVTEETDPTVSEWAKQPTKPSYTADEVGALPVGTKIPTKTSDLTNDSGYLTQIPEEYVTETELGQKGYVIEDDIPEKLPSPGTLTFTGAVNDTYDGSANKTINIPTGGGEGGTSDYNALANKPKLNGVEIAGNKTSTDYKIVSSEQGIENNGKFLGVGVDGNVTLVDKPTYTADEVGARPDTWTPSAEDVGALPNDTEIPSKTSDLENDSGFITGTDIPKKLPNPQKIIFTGAVTAEYDGSTELNVNIPSGGTVDPEQIEQAVNGYLEENPVFVSVDETLTKEGEAADAKVTGEKIELNSYDFKNFKIGEFKPDIEFGNIAFGNVKWTYTSNATRYRTPEGYELKLKKGSIIKLESYENARFCVGCIQENKIKYYTSWMTSDYITETDGNFAILISTISGNEGLENLPNLLFVKNSDNYEYNLEKTKSEINKINTEYDLLDMYLKDLFDFSEVINMRKTGYVISNGTEQSNANGIIRYFDANKMPQYFAIKGINSLTGYIYNKNTGEYSNEILLKSGASTIYYTADIADISETETNLLAISSTDWHTLESGIYREKILISPDYTSKNIGLDESVFNKKTTISLNYTNNNNYIRFVLDLNEILKNINVVMRIVAPNMKIGLQNEYDPSQNMGQTVSSGDFFVPLYRYLIIYADSIKDIPDINIGYINPKNAVNLKKIGYFSEARLSAHNADLKTDLIMSSIVSEFVDIDFNLTLDNKIACTHADLSETNLDDWLNLSPENISPDTAIEICKLYGCKIYVDSRANRDETINILQKCLNSHGKVLYYASREWVTDQDKKNYKYLPVVDYGYNKEQAESDFDRHSGEIYCYYSNPENYSIDTDYISILSIPQNEDLKNYNTSDYIFLEPSDIKNRFFK